MLLDDIKKEFEIIPSAQWYEEYSDRTKVYNTTLRFYINKEYKEICDLVELLYIGFFLIEQSNTHGIFNELSVYKDLLTSITPTEGAESKRLNIKKLYELDNINLSLLVGSRTEYYKNNGNKIFFQDRAAWEIRKFKRRYYYRRRLALWIAPLNTFRVEPMTEKEEADKRYTEMVGK